MLKSMHSRKYIESVLPLIASNNDVNERMFCCCAQVMKVSNRRVLRSFDRHKHVINDKWPCRYAEVLFLSAG